MTRSRGACGRSPAVVALSALLAFAHLAHGQDADVPYVPTPMNVVDAMLKIANVGPQDFVIDLGSGDGRIVIAAARKFGARGLGVELDGALVSDARREAARQGVSSRAEFRAENLFVTDLAPATVLTTYLFPRLNLQIRPRIFEQLKPGTRVVSHEFDFGNWKPDARVTVEVPNKPYGPPRSEVLMWIVPANAAGTWQWRVPVEGHEVPFEVTFEQVFQELRGAGRVAGSAARIENARLRGSELAFTVVANVAGREMRQELAGQVAGDNIRGTAKLGGTQTQWQASRVAPGRIQIDAMAAPGRPAVN